MPVFMLHEHVQAAYPCSCCMSTSVTYVNVHAESSCLRYMSIRMTHDFVHAHVACPCYVSTDCITVDYSTVQFRWHNEAVAEAGGYYIFFTMMIAYLQVNIACKFCFGTLTILDFGVFLLKLTQFVFLIDKR
jgi:hypothetical protein